MTIDPESLLESLLGTDSDERANVYHSMGNALLGEIDARVSAGTPIEQLGAELRQALFLACAYAGEILLRQTKTKKELVH